MKRPEGYEEISMRNDGSVKRSKSNWWIEVRNMKRQVGLEESDEGARPSEKTIEIDPNARSDYILNLKLENLHEKKKRDQKETQALQEAEDILEKYDVLYN